MRRTDSSRSSSLLGKGDNDVEKAIGKTVEQKSPDDSDPALSGQQGRLKQWRAYSKKSWNPLRWRAAPPVPQTRQISKEAGASILSLITFSWMSPIMTTGYLRNLETVDIPLVAPTRQAGVITKKVQASFTERKNRGDKNPLLFALNEVFFKEFWFAGGCRLLADILLIINPFLLRFLIAFAVDSYNAQNGGYPGPPIGRGVGLAVGIAVIQGVTSVTVSQYMYRSMIVGGQARAVLIAMIFDKSLKISGRAKAGGDAAQAFTLAKQQEGKTGGGDSDEKKKGKDSKKAKKEGEGGAWSNGRVVNLMGTDSYRVDQASGWFHIIWTSPIQILLTLALLIVNISYSALAGFGLLVLGVPILSWVVKILALKRRKMNLITDKRVSLTQEILMGVRFVKFFGWEESFLKRLQDIRDSEISAIQFLLGVRSGVTAVGISLPVFASMLAFITYSLTDNSLNPANIFSSLALFNALRLPLNLLPMVIAQTIDAWVSIQRMQEYFLAEEITDSVIHDSDIDSAIEVSKGHFTWEITIPDEIKEKKKKGKSKTSGKNKQVVQDPEKSVDPTPAATGHSTPDEPFTLNSIELSVSPHELLAVVGSVGSGKTSLLAALAGDMRKTGGSVRMSSQLAYCPQYAWIQNATVRDNITFGKPYDPEWYAAVVEACALQPDLDMLPDGDMTEIGERGITVSGGQKQRLNIARAIYFNADIVLMDDPLSAVDAHVGKHLFDKAICGLLDKKCRVLATHQLHVLEKVDRVVWMEDGHIQAVGTFPELMEGNPAFAYMMKEIATEKEEEEKPVAEKDEIEEEEEEAKDEKKKPAAAKLMQAEDRAVASVPWKVYKSYIEASGSLMVAPLLILLLVASQVANIMTTLWLSYWTSGKYGLSTGAYIGVFAGLGVLQSFLMFSFAFGITLAGTQASKVLMQKAMKSTLRAPMSFFDTTPIGRIVNRFSKDIDVMDNNITDAIRMYFLTLCMISSVLILIIVYFHYFAVAIVPLILLFVFAAGYYRSSAREVKRHESVLRSNVFAKFGESLAGVASIRAYGLEERFRTTIATAIDEMNGAYFITFSNQRWLSVRLDLIGVFLVFTTAILVVTSRFQVHPSIAGVVLSYILQIVMMLQWMIRQLAEVENAMNATERIHHYATSLPQEAALHTNASTHLRPTWPETAAISFNAASMRYRPELPLVLKGLNLNIPGGARVGIVGRTGAGKSSITSALFRLVELSSGSITIDGVDIATLGLHTLRTKLAIIPQDPTLFRGTIRSNLDPFTEHTDANLTAALKSSYLDHLSLDATVEEEGLNFSLGQRQQMALARALVRGAKVVVADEATSSVDVETDTLIQRSMKEGFRGRTLVVIAHRLKTVVTMDYIVVMDAGEVVEFDTPETLWRRGGVFRGMCDRGGVGERDFPAAVEAGPERIKELEG